MILLIFFNKHIKLLFSFLFIFSLTILTGKLNAQVFDSEQNPPSIKWRQINTEYLQVIYPMELESEAQRILSVLEAIMVRERISIKARQKKISIILQNQGTTANGFVQLAPRRSEFYTTPSQSFDFQSWLNSLAVHEMRHVIQFDKLTGKLNAPFFEELALAIFGITLPPWFYEGDAVGMETALTDAGRGRIPEWSNILRANTLSQRNFSYSKNYLGSLKDFTPGYYQLGYFMTSKLRKDYGANIMDSIYSTMTRNPLRPYNLSRAIHKITGMNTRQLHDATIKELQDLWQAQADQSNPIDYPSINKRKTNTPENYNLPQPVAGGNILALKQGKASVPKIVLITPEGKEKKILNIGAQELPWFSYGGGKITWDEYRSDARFHQRSFNVINVYNLTTKRARQITHKTRLFSPSLSPDGKRIIAVSVSYSNQILLVEFDPENGRELKRYDSPDNNMLQMPSFNPDGSKVVVVGVNDSGKTIYELDTKTGTFTSLLPFQLQEILRPVYGNQDIFFKAHYNGTDNIYRFNLTDRQTYQVTSDKIGAYNPFYDTISGRLTFNTYTVFGHDIAALNTKSLLNKNINTLESHFVDYGAKAQEQEGNNNVLQNVNYKTYPSRKYREWSNLFYFHSIIPIVEDNAYFDDSNFGIELQSDNKLNTMSFYTGYQFNNALQKSEYLAGFAYKRFFPIFSVNYTNRPRLIYRQTTVNKVTTYSPVTWRENEIKAEMTIPFNFNRFNHSYSLGLKTGTSFTNRYDVENGMTSLITRLNFPMHYQFYASHNTRRSSRDLAPKWGQNFSFLYRHFPFEDQVKGKLFSAKSTFYFPGLAENHSFAASFNFQDGDGSYQNSVDIPRVSGYSFLTPIGNTNNTLLLDYRLPLFYPDFAIGPLAYIKRIQGGLFSDFENIGKGKSFSPRSYGAELRADVNILRFFLPIFNFGGKVVFLNEKPHRNPVFETIATYSF
ncbi:hypothetical protein ADIARSV_1913 [Arcticibacter svalbardensis MN12-7]|uniref:TolB protein n=1 Tax=Arcticibacter svalbardensis MN12-7 TaxID=1150600 RepID=R9GSW2_9SPHI|nr:hypothetical protein [Arcticibacter svalbardensis]EOR94952.1 hypothetical protein ADIARSV_1913 [Arcticibacter svalbardensis MN12-7]